MKRTISTAALLAIAAVVLFAWWHGEHRHMNYVTWKMLDSPGTLILGDPKTETAVRWQGDSYELFSEKNGVLGSGNIRTGTWTSYGPQLLATWTVCDEDGNVVSHEEVYTQERLDELMNGGIE